LSGVRQHPPVTAYPRSVA